MKTVGKLRKKASRTAYAVMRNHPRLRLAVRHGYWGLMRKRYDHKAARVPTDYRLVFFESYQGRGMGDSPRAIYEAMLADERFSDYVFIWSFYDAEHVPAEGLDEVRTIVVLRGTDEYFEAIAMSHYIVMNMRLPEYVYPKSNQVFVQCWHGTPFKKLANDIGIQTANALNTESELAWRYRMDSEKWTYLVSASSFETKALCSAFGLPKDEWAKKALEVGDPGNDILVRARADDEARVRAARALGVPDGKKALLYAPTWRDDAYEPGVGYTVDYLCDFEKLKSALGDEWVVLFRAHYFIGNTLDFDAYDGFVIDVSREKDINACYIASDAMVTDYSSVMFDYPNLRRPLLLYVPDLDHYATELRDFYFDINDVPGPLCKTTDDLVEALRGFDAYFDRYDGEYAAFVERFCPFEDGHASERVLDALL